VRQIDTRSVDYESLTMETDGDGGVWLKSTPTHIVISPRSLLLDLPRIEWKLESGDRSGQVTFHADNYTARYEVLGYDVRSDLLFAQLVHTEDRS